MVLDVIEVELELPHRVLDRRAVRRPDLGPAGDPRLDAMAHAVERDLMGELLDEARPLRPRANEAHLALQHVDELRQLVNPRAAEKPPDAGHARVVDRGPFRLAVRLRLADHAAELQQPELLTPRADALLAVDDWGPALERDCQRGDHHDRRRKREEHERNEQIEQPFDGAARPVLPEAIAVDEPARLERCEGYLAARALDEAGEVAHAHAVDAARKQLVER